MIEKLVWWLYDPILWIGLFNLIIIEIVLGVDNLIFITILSEKLSNKRNNAVAVGLISALLIRISLLFSLNYLISLNQPNIIIFGFLFSIKDFLILFGGLFLMFKATTELHERIEGKDLQEKDHRNDKRTAKYWYIIIQIILLDTIFSVDSIITAIGIIDHIQVVITAIIISTILMIIASKQLTGLIHSNPTIVILCLSFLLMIGFSLFLEGFGCSIPKGYLYFSVSFSILIEILNQFAILNRRKILKNRKLLRARTVENHLRILEGKHDLAIDSHEETSNLSNDTNSSFNCREKQMIIRFLRFAQRNVNSVMTSKNDIKYVDIDQTKEDILKVIKKNRLNYVVIINASISDEPIGIAHVSDILKQQLKNQTFDLRKLITKPLILPNNLSLLQSIEQFQQSKEHFAFVSDKFGSIKGTITLIDVMRTISGNIQFDQGEEGFQI
ncbi:TerC family protein [Candidatus Riesia pediculischaeffi]|uniref:CBS domain-containing protein n=2 Tax=Candidatus Riesia pediculischaeffi TaxID=428411 RepID=A0A1V0HJV8_9ENTR|nr:CBS domain-containing protein [Candidatus Riesia pediculischaeffi]ARC53115.1 hypothetical protein AOQ87_00105 [Candidatus Riesia pediculischaeffi]KIE64267.1 integral membrane protein / hemolysin [Candidatus Riesia pediculischaeffi PTSU]